MRVGRISTDLFDPRDSILMQMTEEVEEVEDEVGVEEEDREEVGVVEEEEEEAGVEEEEEDEEVGVEEEIEDEEGDEVEEEVAPLKSCVLDILDFNIGMTSWGTSSRTCAEVGVLLDVRVVEEECNGCLIGV